MKQITGYHEGQTVRIDNQQAWRHASFLNCTLHANPRSALAFVEDVHCLDCTFVYDGMEVDAAEWLALIARRPHPYPVDPTH